jgi:pilus assembly protein CpaB
MRAKSMAMLMLALGCGLVAAIGFTQVMAKRNAEPVSTGEMQPIFVAAKDISLSERLSSEMLKLESWPKDKVPLGAVTKIEDVEGCRTRTKLYAGEPILEKKLYSKGTSLQGDSVIIPNNYRVVSVKVDNVSGGPGLVMPGDRVDVLVHLLRNASQDIQETTTRTILQNIKVFAVNDVVDIEQQKDSKDKEKMSAKTISLLVTPSQAATLTLASEMGKVRLIMRNPEDESTSVEGVSKPSDLLGGAKIADRDNEKVYKPDEPAATAATAPAKPSGLTTLLEKMKTQLKDKAKTTVSNLPTETWKMRILLPRGVNEIQMEPDVGPHAAKMPNSWHTISNTPAGTINASSSAEVEKKQSVPVAGPPPKATVEPPKAEPPKAEPPKADPPKAETPAVPDPPESKPADKEPVVEPVATPNEPESSGFKTSD